MVWGFVDELPDSTLSQPKSGALIISNFPNKETSNAFIVCPSAYTQLASGQDRSEI